MTTAKNTEAPGVWIAVPWVPPIIISLPLWRALHAAAQPALLQAWVVGFAQAIVMLAPGNTGKVKLSEIPGAWEFPLPIVGDVTVRRCFSNLYDGLQFELSLPEEGLPLLAPTEVHEIDLQHLRRSLRRLPEGDE